MASRYFQHNFFPTGIAFRPIGALVTLRVLRRGDKRRRLRFCDRAQRRRAQVVLSLANETSRKRPTPMVRPTGANAGRSGDCAHAEAPGRCEANRCGTVVGPREASPGAGASASPNAGGQRAGNARRGASGRAATAPLASGLWH